jgi:hypothetical protein
MAATVLSNNLIVFWFAVSAAVLGFVASLCFPAIRTNANSVPVTGYQCLMWGYLSGVENLLFPVCWLANFSGPPALLLVLFALTTAPTDDHAYGAARTAAVLAAITVALASLMIPMRLIPDGAGRPQCAELLVGYYFWLGSGIVLCSSSFLLTRVFSRNARRMAAAFAFQEGIQRASDKATSTAVSAATPTMYLCSAQPLAAVVKREPTNPQAA